MVWMSFRRKRSTAALISPSIPTAISASSRSRGGAKKSGHGWLHRRVRLQAGRLGDDGVAAPVRALRAGRNELQELAVHLRPPGVDRPRLVHVDIKASADIGGTVPRRQELPVS